MHDADDDANCSGSVAAATAIVTRGDHACTEFACPGQLATIDPACIYILPACLRTVLVTMDRRLLYVWPRLLVVACSISASSIDRPCRKPDKPDMMSVGIIAFAGFSNGLIILQTPFPSIPLSTLSFSFPVPPSLSFPLF